MTDSGASDWASADVLYVFLILLRYALRPHRRRIRPHLACHSDGCLVQQLRRNWRLSRALGGVSPCLCNIIPHAAHRTSEKNSCITTSCPSSALYRTFGVRTPGLSAEVICFFGLILLLGSLLSSEIVEALTIGRGEDAMTAKDLLGRDSWTSHSKTSPSRPASRTWRSLPAVRRSVYPYPKVCRSTLPV